MAVQKAVDAYAKVVKETKSAAQRSQARGKVQMLTHELGVIVRRLEARMLEEKRQQVYYSYSTSIGTILVLCSKYKYFNSFVPMQSFYSCSTL